MYGKNLTITITGDKGSGKTLLAALLLKLLPITYDIKIVTDSNPESDYLMSEASSYTENSKLEPSDLKIAIINK